jgi:hypothetical protein
LSTNVETRTMVLTSGVGARMAEKKVNTGSVMFFFSPCGSSNDGALLSSSPSLVGLLLANKRPVTWLFFNENSNVDGARISCRLGRWE